MSGIGQHNLCLVESLVGLVDDDIVEHAGLGIFLLYIKVDIGDAVVEDAFGDFHRRLAFAHGDDELPQTALGTGREGILEIERYSGGEDAEYNDGPHDAEEGDAGGLHGEKLKVFAHVAEGDERGQKEGQRQCLRDEGDAHVPEELCQYVECQTFAHKVVNIAPCELHHEDEQTHEEGCNEHLQELCSDECVYPFWLQGIQ